VLTAAGVPGALLLVGLPATAADLCASPDRAGKVVGMQEGEGLGGWSRGGGLSRGLLPHPMPPPFQFAPAPPVWVLVWALDCRRLANSATSFRWITCRELMPAVRRHSGPTRAGGPWERSSGSRGGDQVVKFFDTARPLRTNSMNLCSGGRGYHSGVGSGRRLASRPEGGETA